MVSMTYTVALMKFVFRSGPLHLLFGAGAAADWSWSVQLQQAGQRTPRNTIGGRVRQDDPHV